MMQHTPAPWTLAVPRPNGGIGILHEYETPERGPGREVAGIAVVSFAGTATAANARLIAAAPDLLAALETLCDEWYGLWVGSHAKFTAPEIEHARATEASARAVIALARGESVPA